MATGDCPLCDSSIELSKDASIGEKIKCPHCREPLRLASLQPVLFEFLNQTQGLDTSPDSTELDKPHTRYEPPPESQLFEYDENEGYTVPDVEEPDI